MIGHCLGASAGLEAIAAVKAISTGWVHPTINQFVCATYLASFLLQCMPVVLYISFYKIIFGVSVLA